MKYIKEMFGPNENQFIIRDHVAGYGKEFLIKYESTGEESLYLESMMVGNKLDVDIKKEMIKKKFKLVVTVMEYYIKTLSEAKLSRLGNIVWIDYKFDKVVLYGKGGKQIKIPSKLISVHDLDNEKWPEVHSMMTEIDKKMVIYDTMDRMDMSIDKMDILKIFEKGSGVEKLMMYSLYQVGEDMNLVNDPDLSKQEKENVRFIKNMHNKKWMQEFGAMNDLDNLGIFDDD